MSLFVQHAAVRVFVWKGELITLSLRPGTFFGGCGIALAFARKAVLQDQSWRKNWEGIN